MKRRSFLSSAMMLSTVPMFVSSAWAKTGKVQKLKLPKDTMFPRVFKANEKALIKIELANKEYLSKPLEVKCIRSDGFLCTGKRAEYRAYDSLEFSIKDGAIYINHLFKGQQSHLFIVCPKGATQPKDFIARFMAYSLSPEMFALKAVKGEFHLHSTISDGKASEADMLVECMKCGYDFAAMSDHKVMCDWFGRPKGHKTLVEYGYQQISYDTLKKLKSSMRVFEAEEVHLNHYVHFHNFGGSRGVVQWAYENPVEYKNELQKRISKLAGKYKSQDTLEQMAIADLVFDKVKDYGGISIFNHPTWNIAGHLGMTDEVMQELMLSEKCDAIEVANSNYKENVQAYAAVQKYAIMQGKQPRLVGNSDAHRTDKVGSSYTIAFVEDISIPSIKKAIRQNKSLGVDANNKIPMIMGDYDLVKYAYFLEEEYFPVIKEIRAKEADTLKDVFSSNSGFEKFAEYKKQIADFNSLFFAK
ncbi:MAG: hypothetical protein J6B07_07415 [Opitutales bacterium]|nr:hypothetical protein [Opitutales bacterium]